MQMAQMGREGLKVWRAQEDRMCDMGLVEPGDRQVTRVYGEMYLLEQNWWIKLER